VQFSYFVELLRRGDVAEGFFTDAHTLAFRTRRPVADYEARLGAISPYSPLRA
jgi:hypothetical protein